MIVHTSVALILVLLCMTVFLRVIGVIIAQATTISIESQCGVPTDIKWNPVDGFVYIACSSNIIVMNESSVVNSIGYIGSIIGGYPAELTPYYLNIDPNTGTVFTICAQFSSYPQYLFLSNRTSVTRIIQLDVADSTLDFDQYSTFTFDYSRNTFYGPLVDSSDSLENFFASTNFSASLTNPSTLPEIAILFEVADSPYGAPYYLNCVVDSTSGLVFASYLIVPEENTYSFLLYRYNSSNGLVEIIVSMPTFCSGVLLNSFGELITTSITDVLPYELLTFSINGTILSSVDISGEWSPNSAYQVVDLSTNAIYSGGFVLFPDGLSFPAFPTSGISSMAVNLQSKVLYGIYNDQADICVSICLPGSYQMGPSQLCTYCPATFYCPTVDQANMTLCPPRYYCPLGSFSPALCPEGYWCLTASYAPFRCTIGHFCPQGTSQMVNCTEGSYCSTTALALPNGMCALGQYCPTGSVSPISCAAGGYCPYVNMSSPILCSLGTYCPLTGSFNPGFLCSPGSFCNSLGSLITPNGPCPSQYYCPLGTIDPLPCALGFTSGPGALQCFSCPVGFVVSNGTCLGCPSGYAAINSSSCGACPGGYYCPPASLLPYAISCSSSSSLYCPPLSVQPQIVPDNYYSNNSSSALMLCDPGFVCSAGILIPCSAGRFNGVPGSPSCLDCPGEFYAPNISSTSCLPCPSGQTTLSNGSSSCIGCVPGQASIGIGGKCEACPRGSYTMASNSISCSSCDAGYYTTADGSVACIPCPTGSYSPTSSWNVSCISCEPGYYASSVGSTMCSSCIANTFTGIASSLGCSPCPEGTAVNANHTICLSPSCYPG